MLDEYKKTAKNEHINAAYTSRKRALAATGAYAGARARFLALHPADATTAADAFNPILQIHVATDTLAAGKFRFHADNDSGAPMDVAAIEGDAVIEADEDNAEDINKNDYYGIHTYYDTYIGISNDQEDNQ